MSDGPYSHEKVFHHRERIDALRRGARPSPAHVQIIPTNVCNQRCNFCAYRDPVYCCNETFDERLSIPSERLRELVAECAALGVGAIEVTGGGEPTCHPDFLDLCRNIMEHGIDLGVVTNGKRWTSEHAETLAGAKWVRFSLDAGQASTYATLRRQKPETYDLVRAAVRMQAAVTSPGSDPLVGVGFVVTRENWPEVVEAAEKARDDGADNFRISAKFQNDGAAYFDGFGMEAAKLCCHAKGLQTDTFRVFDQFSARVGDLRQGHPSHPFCGIQHLATIVGADLNVYRCCVLAYNRRGLLGSIAERSLGDLWHSAEVAAEMESFDARGCPRCMFNAKNATIRYALDPHPQHVNFL